jgi:hypothetical protein
VGSPRCRDATRYERWWSPHGPLRLDTLAYGDFFTEPLYQLWRQQCLAWEMERAGELDAERVKLVVAAPSANRGYWDAVPAHLTDYYSDVSQLWHELLREPDRFAVVDTAVLVADESPLPDSFRERYGHLQSLTTVDPVEDEAGTIEELVSAAERTRAIGLRVLTEGGVVAQLLDRRDRLDRISTDDRVALIRQLDELSELTRRLRAEAIHDALDATDHSRSDLTT